MLLLNQICSAKKMVPKKDGCVLFLRIEVRHNKILFGFHIFKIQNLSKLENKYLNFLFYYLFSKSVIFSLIASLSNTGDGWREQGELV